MRWSQPTMTGKRLRRAWWNVPLGWQLGSLYAGLLASVLLIAGALLYTQLDAFLVQNTATRLCETARPLLTNPVRFGGARSSTETPAHPVDPRPFNPEQAGGYLVRGLSGPDVTVAVLNQDGQVITQTQGLEGQVLSPLPFLPAGWRAAVEA